MDIEAFLKRQEEYKRTAMEAEKDRAERRRAEKRPYLDKIRGGLVGGAIGDALGYQVEFLSWKEIRKRYGIDGIQQYEIDKETGSAVFSDDTQMSLFTANGILIGETHGHLKCIQGAVADYVYIAYKDWLKTQQWGSDPGQEHHCWLYEIPALHCDRAPGMTCMSALRSGKMGSTAVPLNSSKGCGGVMRVAPLALHYRPVTDSDQRHLDEDGAEIAAITHGHPLGYLPAAILTHIISIGVYGEGEQSLRDAVDNAWAAVRDLFTDKVPAADLDYMEKLITKAETLAGADGADEEHIRAIGEGWTGDEALAIAVYCSLRYPEDFSKAVTAAVNHSGDSDSTGAVTGNILGSWLGYNAIDEKWKTNLEMLDVLLEMSDDLCYGCVMYDGEEYVDEKWIGKYCEAHAG